MVKLGSALTLMSLFVGSLGAEIDEKPLTLKQVEDLVDAKVDGARVAEAIRSRGVHFLASDACLGFFLGLGANDEVEAALRSAGQAPFSKEELLREIAHQPTGQSLAGSVRTRGINFHPTAEDLDTLKVAGADAGLIESIRSSTIRSEEQFEPCPPDTGKAGIADNPTQPEAKTRTAESPTPRQSVTPSTGPTEPAGAEPAHGGERAKTNAVVSAEVTAPPALLGGLDIVTDPPGLEIVIDGRSYGPSPVHTALSEGEHTYRVKPTGLRTFEKKFTITSGTIRILHVDFVPLPVPPTGTLVVETNPPGATVEVDSGSFEGWTPATFELAAGPHQLRLSLDGYRPVARPVEVGGDATITLRQDMRRTLMLVRRSRARQGH
jgi:PEGA domain-containing protein